MQHPAGVVKLVDTPDLGSGGESHGGSSPSARTSLALSLIFEDHFFDVGY